MTRWAGLFMLFVIVIWSCPLTGQAPHPDRSAIVAQAKADLQAAHVDLQSPCGAFAILELATWRDRATGAGLLDKPTGNNCRGFSVDILAYPDGAIFDVLINAETDNSPAWQFVGFVDPSRYRPAHESTRLPDFPPLIIPPVVPPPLPAIDLTPVLQRLDLLHAEHRADTEQILSRIEQLEQDAKGFIHGLSKYIPYIMTALGVISAVK